ncbi:hypothetical protein GCM10017600_40150 [Streptosporangium carneum]|uniref:Uncharacterized protein n=1 Tax=Streptosporangium carneum TaxID=47481 RepID=A0A9W6I436_9ACTN|nr:hypothetical protein GCM10017600_40150 [Streptosporangium carneum]
MDIQIRPCGGQRVEGVIGDLPHTGKGNPKVRNPRDLLVGTVGALEGVPEGERAALDPLL